MVGAEAAVSSVEVGRCGGLFGGRGVGADGSYGWRGRVHDYCVLSKCCGEACGAWWVGLLEVEHTSRSGDVGAGSRWPGRLGRLRSVRALGVSEVRDLRCFVLETHKGVAKIMQCSRHWLRRLSIVAAKVYWDRCSHAGRECEGPAPLTGMPS